MLSPTLVEGGLTVVSKTTSKPSPTLAALLNWTVLGEGVTFVQIAGFAWLWAAILAM